MGRKNRRFGMTLLAAILSGLMMVGVIGATDAAGEEGSPSGSSSPNTALAGGCVGGVVCAFLATNFGGEASWFSCNEVEQTVFLEFLSAKNNCGSHNVDIGWKEGGTVNWKACMAPGGERPNPGRFNTVKPSC